MRRGKTLSKNVGSRKRRSRNSRSGAAVVEFAIVGPLMIMLTMGMMELSRVVMVKQLMIHATREGARMASLNGTTTSDVVSFVQQELQSQSVAGTSISTIPAEVSGVTGGSQVTVQISVPAALVSWIPTPMFTGNTTLTAETTMRRENN